MDDREFQDTLLPKMVQLNTEPLDPNVIAAFVDGELSEREHEAVEARIAADPEALLLVKALREDAARPVLTAWRLAALAAAVLVAVGAWWALGDGAEERSFDVRLAAAASDLGRRSPELFGSFTLLAEDELGAEAPVARGGARWLAPQGVLIQSPTRLRWVNPPGTSRVEVSLKRGSFRWSQEVEGAQELAAPALSPGRYVVRLRALDSLAGQEIRRSFVVADEEEREHLERGLALIRSSAPADIAEVVAAHYAVRAQAYEEARRAAAAARALGGASAAAAEAVLAHLDSLAR